MIDISRVVRCLWDRLGLVGRGSVDFKGFVGFWLDLIDFCCGFVRLGSVDFNEV
jgi:hypothetical protein